MDACRYEQVRRGSCRRGATCNFSHDLGFDPAGTGRTIAKLAPTAPSFTPGLTSLAPLAATLPSETQHERQDTRASKPCTFHQQRRCAKRTNCPFSHAGPVHQPSDNTASHHRNTQDASAAGDGEFNIETLHDLTRTFQGLLVVYSQGAEVAKVSLPQDFSTASLTGLPPQISDHAISDLLGLFEIDIFKASVKLTSTASGTAALIKAEDPEFAKYIYRALTPTVAKDVGYPSVKVDVLPTAIISGAATQRVNCRTVSCSWHRATVTVYLRYRDQGKAEDVRNKFNNGFYELGGLRVQGTVQSPPLHPLGRYHVRSQIWNVIVPNVPAQVTREQMKRVLEASDTPFEFDMSSPSYPYGVQRVAEAVRNKLSHTGHLDSFVYNPDAPGKRHKAVAVFRDENDALKACATLNETTLLGTVKLYLELNTTAKIKVLTTIYDTLKSEVGELMRQHSKVRFNFWRNTDPAQRFTVVKISASDTADLGPAKAGMNTLLEGHVANVDGEKIWHASFAGSTGAQTLKEVESKTKVLIVNEPASCSLRLFGPDKCCRDASRALADLIESFNSKAQEIVLDPTMFSIVIKGAYSRFQSLLGQDHVSLDISSKSKKIIIRGNEQDCRLARQILNQWSVNQARRAENHCPICWTKAERPVTTHCGHIYCADCFENMCAAASSAQADCKIECQGLEGSCKQVLTLNDLQENLTTSAFEAVLQSSLNTYIRRRPEKFNSCPTTDCGQIYRLPTTSQSASKPGSAPTQLCLKCLNSICLNCHACHGRMTCADYKYISSGEAADVEKLKKQLGIKDCPRCKTAMEKTEGCNHMLCKGCGIHICWVCLRTFSESGSTYKHMNESHGGIGLDHLAHI